MAVPLSDIGTRWKMRRFEQFLNRSTGSLTERFGASEVALTGGEYRG